MAKKTKRETWFWAEINNGDGVMRLEIDRARALPEHREMFEAIGRFIVDQYEATRAAIDARQEREAAGDAARRES